MTDSLSNSTDVRQVPSGGRISGRLRPPSSKSLTQRYYNLALIAAGTTVVQTPLRSEDCDHFLAGLVAAGCAVNDQTERVEIKGPTGPGSAEVFCGASGTMMRFMTAALCTVAGRWKLDGTDRLRKRPQGTLLSALAVLGAEVSQLGEVGALPLEIKGGSLVGGQTGIAAHESSQFVSALLMAGAAAPAGLTLVVENLVSEPYVALTEQALALFGVRVLRPRAGVFAVRAGRPTGASVTVEPDLSAACYPAAAAALTGGEVVIEGVERSSVQGDRRFFDLLADMGANVDWNRGAVRVAGRRPLEAIQVDLSDMPDQVPTLAALAPFAAGTTHINNVAHLRIKESDRLAAMALELRRLGADVEERDDGLSIEGSWSRSSAPTTPVTTQSHDDHRIAMSCALVGLRREGVSVAEPQVVGKSYPSFWSDLTGLMS